MNISILISIFITAFITSSFIMYTKKSLTVHDNAEAVLICFKELFSDESKKEFLNDNSLKRKQILSVMTLRLPVTLLVYKLFKKKIHLLLIFDIIFLIISNIIIFYI